MAAALDAVNGGGIPRDAQRVFVEQIAPSVFEARNNAANTVGSSTDPAVDSPADRGLDRRAIESAHAVATAERLVEGIPEIGARLRAGTIGVVAARYRLSDGVVEAVNCRGVRSR